ncbi:MAG: hypothetical protein OQL20_07815 [Sedimenticola sp.]|nr:hypothetical protein [Sedimenticola sp.]
MQRTALPLLFLLLPLASQAMSGGSCRYTPLATPAQVIAATSSEVQLLTDSIGAITLERSHFSDVPEIGAHYQLRLQTLSEGACNPLQVIGITRLAPNE